MVSFESVSKSSPVYFVVFAVDYLSPVVVKHDYSVKHIVRDLLDATAHALVDFPVQVNCLVIAKCLHFLALFVFKLLHFIVVISIRYMKEVIIALKK